METDGEAVRTKVRERYPIAATGRGSCQDDACCASGYSSAELARIPAESVLGLGSGNPVRHAELRPGETVVDLGSGGGIDVFLASSLVGPGGSATGGDMTPRMVARAPTVAEWSNGDRRIRGDPHREKTGPGGEYVIPMEITLAKALANDLWAESCCGGAPCCGGDCCSCGG